MYYSIVTKFCTLVQMGAANPLVGGAKLIEQLSAGGPDVIGL